MKARIKQITIPHGKRTICISDIHGSLDVFKRLLDTVGYTGEDILILLGDLFAKGKQCRETLVFIMEMSQNPDVHILLGNCDRRYDYITDTENEWLESLPHIIESEEYIFVHGGLTSEDLYEQEARACTKNDAFMEKAQSFNKYVVTGHWPTINYTHEIPCCNPIVNHEKHIIAIDGGCVIKDAGQLNAFIINNGEYSFTAIDDFPKMRVEKPQAESGGNLCITWNDKHVELVEEGSEFSLFRHAATGRGIEIPNRFVWKDNDGKLCGCWNGFDYYLPVGVGDIVSVAERFSDRLLVKKDGVVGWLKTV